MNNLTSTNCFSIFRWESKW